MQQELRTCSAGRRARAPWVLVLRPSEAGGSFQVHGGLRDHLWSAAACAHFPPRLGCVGHGWSAASEGARAGGRGCRRRGMRNTCAALVSDAVGAPVRHAETPSSLSVFLRPPVKRRGGRRWGGVPGRARKMGLERIHVTGLAGTLRLCRLKRGSALQSHKSQAGSHINRHRTAKAQVTPRRDHRALFQRL